MFDGITEEQLEQAIKAFRYEYANELACDEAHIKNSISCFKTKIRQWHIEGFVMKSVSISDYLTAEQQEQVKIWCLDNIRDKKKRVEQCAE